MTRPFRVIDTGVRDGRRQIAFDQALIDLHRAGSVPDTIRFLRFPRTVLIGRHQALSREIRLDHCRREGIGIVRRITGGGAIYFDETQIGWELYLHKRDVGTADMQAISRRICHAAATAISALGVDARYRPRNDIEVDGRKISGTGGAFDGDALLFQGTLLIDFDVEKMLRVLRISAEKLSDKAIATARERVANLKELLGRAPDPAQVRRNITEAFESEFDVEFGEGDLTLSEHQRYQTALSEIDTPDWVNLVTRPAADMPILEGVQKFAGGLLRAAVTLDTRTQTLRQVWFTGDIFISPRRTVADLEAALRDLPLDRLETRVQSFFSERKADMLSLAPQDFITVVRLAVKQPLTDAVNR